MNHHLLRSLTCLLICCLLAGTGVAQQSARTETWPPPRDTATAAKAHTKHEAHRSGPLDGCAEACVGACIGIGCSLAGDFLFSGLIDYHQYILAQKPDVPRVVSLDVMAHGGAWPGGIMVFGPRIRGNLGFFSTDFRLMQASRSGAGYRETFRSLDWQVVAFNLVNFSPLALRLGIGLMYLPNTQEWLSEYSLGLDIFFAGDAFFLQTEGRYGTDYVSDMAPRWELNGGFNVRFVESDHFWGYVTAGGIYQEYSGVPLHSFFGGLRFNLH